MREYPQGLWSVLLQVGQPQKDHVIDRVGPMALLDQVVVVVVVVEVEVEVEVAMNHKASHPELWVVYFVDCLSLV